MNKFLGVLLVLGYAGVALAQEPGPGAGKPAAPPDVQRPKVGPGAPASGAESIEAFQKLNQDILSAARSGDREKLSALLQGLILQNHDAWFKRVFNPESGGRLSAEYGRRLPMLDQELRRIYEDRARERGVEMRVTRLEWGTKFLTPQQAALFAAMKEPVALYSVTWIRAIGAVPVPPPPPPPPPKPGVPPPPEPVEGVPPPPVATPDSPHDLAWFAFVDGGFRYVGPMKEIRKTEGPGGK